MRYYNYPIKTRFSYLVSVDIGEIIIRYQQATVEETILFSEMDDKEIYEWLLNFVKENSEYKFYVEKKWYMTESFYLKKKYEIQKKLEELLSNNLGKIGKQILETRFRQHKSIFSGIKPKKKGRNSIFNVNIKAICDSYNINGPHELLKKYTMEQLDWMIDGIVFSNNESDDDGKDMNNRAYSNNFVDKDALKEKLDSAKEFYKKLQKQREKNKKGL